MPYYTIHALDAPGKASARSEARPSHRARLREHDYDVTVRIGGPLLNDRGDMCGTLLVIEADDKAKVVEFLQGDPYSQAGVYERVEIHEFNWGLGKPEVDHG